MRLLLKEGDFGPHPAHSEHPLVILRGRVRKSAEGWVVTVFLVNQQPERRGRNEPKDEAWVFQPKLRVRGTIGRPVFVQRCSRQADLTRFDAITREETETLEMLYRRRHEFAQACRVREIGEYHRRASARLHDVVRQFFGVGARVKRVQHHRIAGMRQCQRDGAADPAPCPGDQGRARRGCCLVVRH